MARPKNPVPSYRLHKQSGKAVVTVTLNGVRRDILLGKYGTPESKAEYARVIAELQAHGPAAVAHTHGGAADPTVNEVLLAFMRWADTHYRGPGGQPTTEVNELKRSLATVRELYGHTPAKDFGPKALAAVRQKMIDAGWCRSLINRRADRVKRVWKWASAEELVPVTAYQALRSLAGLRKGRSPARESEPVKPVDPETVDATLPFLNRHLRTMVELQRLTGMRPGEVCKLRLSEVDRSGELWVYRPAEHKTAHYGKDRTVPLGPKAQAAVTAFLWGDHPPPAGFDRVDLTDPTARMIAADAYQEAGRVRDAELLRDTARPVVLVAGCVVDPALPLFSPYYAREERFRAARAKRKSKVQPSQESRRRATPKRLPSAEYTPHTFTHAIRIAAEKAKAPHWHPNQLRHTFATIVRRRYGLEAAQVLLGHSRADVTQMYADRDASLANKVAEDIG